MTFNFTGRLGTPASILGNFELGAVDPFYPYEASGGVIVSIDANEKIEFVYNSEALINIYTTFDVVFTPNPLPEPPVSPPPPITRNNNYANDLGAGFIVGGVVSGPALYGVPILGVEIYFRYKAHKYKERKSANPLISVGIKKDPAIIIAETQGSITLKGFRQKYGKTHHIQK